MNTMKKIMNFFKIDSVSASNIEDELLENNIMFSQKRIKFISLILLNALVCSLYMLLLEIVLILFLQKNMTDPEVLEYVVEVTQIQVEENVKAKPIPEGYHLIQIEEEKSQIALAIEYQYFTYPKPKQADLAYVNKTIPASIVHLYDGNYGINGSGFIMEITEDFLYIVTNYHVAQYMEDGCRVYFSKNVWAVGEFMGKDDFFDVAVFRVSINQLSEKEVLGLRTVSVDRNAITNLKQESGLTMLVEYFNSRNFTNTGEFLEEMVVIPDLPQLYTLTTLASKPGASGSPIFDYYGNLIGMNYGRYWEYGSEHYKNICVPLLYLLESYQEITGRGLQF